MAGVEPGKLRTLAWLIREHREAVELTLIQAGLRLRNMGKPGTSWGDIWAVVSHAANTAGTPLAISIDPRSEWPIETYLLADIADGIRFIAWSKTKDAERNRARPTPIPRPGAKTAASEIQTMTADEMKRYLARPRIEIPTPRGE